MRNPGTPRKVETAFAKFAQILERYYGKDLTIAEYIKKLLCAITDDEDKISNGRDGEREYGNYSQYYYGKKDITPIAKAIYKDLNPEKFKGFLNNFYYSYKSNLCKDFKKYIPDINTNNVFDKITEIFVIIIKETSKIPDGRCKSKTKSLDESIEPQSQGFIELVESIIKQLKGIDTTDEKLQENITKPEEQSQKYVDKNSLEYIVLEMQETLESMIECGRTIADFPGETESPYSFNSGQIVEIVNKYTNGYDYKTLKAIKQKLTVQYDCFVDLIIQLSNHKDSKNNKLIQELLKWSRQISYKSVIESENSFMIINIKNKAVHETRTLIQNFLEPPESTD